MIKLENQMTRIIKIISLASFVIYANCASSGNELIYPIFSNINNEIQLEDPDNITIFKGIMSSPNDFPEFQGRMTPLVTLPIQWKIENTKIATSIQGGNALIWDFTTGERARILKWGACSFICAATFEDSVFIHQKFFGEDYWGVSIFRMDANKVGGRVDNLDSLLEIKLDLPEAQIGAIDRIVAGSEHFAVTTKGGYVYIYDLKSFSLVRRIDMGSEAIYDSDPKIKNIYFAKNRVFVSGSSGINYEFIGENFILSESTIVANNWFNERYRLGRTWAIDELGIVDLREADEIPLRISYYYPVEYPKKTYSPLIYGYKDESDRALILLDESLSFRNLNFDLGVLDETLEFPREVLDGNFDMVDVYALSGQVIVSVASRDNDASFLLSYRNGFRVNKPETIFVLTHGFQPGVDIVDFGTSRLPQIRESLNQRLKTEGKQDMTEIIEFTWPEAFRPISALSDGYPASRAAVRPAGRRLASQIETRIKEIQEATGKPYRPKIHMIGHSLGTMVNAEASYFLTHQDQLVHLDSPVTIDQFTILDSPLDPAVVLDENNYEVNFTSIFFKAHENYFYERLAATGYIRYVENFYTKSYYRFDQGLAFGEKIHGAGPASNEIPEFFGVRVPFVGHTGIVDYYAELIHGERVDPRSNGWNSPVLDDWVIHTLWDPAQAIDSQNRGVRHKYLDWLNPVRLIGNTISLGGFSHRLITASPAGLEADVLIPEDTYELLIPLSASQGSGTVSVYVNEELLYSSPFSEENPIEIIEALVPSANYAGEEVVFKVMLIPEGLGASVQLDRIIARSTVSSSDRNTILDQDNDSLPDAWELLNFGNLNSNGSKDSDGDGLPNVFESAFGRDPMLIENVENLGVSVSEMGDAVLTLHMASAAIGSAFDFTLDGQRTVLEFSPDLKQWQPISPTQIRNVENLSSTVPGAKSHRLILNKKAPGFFRWRSYSDGSVIFPTVRVPISPD